MHPVTLTLAFLTGTLAQETRENPEYRSWASQKPGAGATYREVTESDGAKAEAEVTYTLTRIAPEAAVVEIVSRAEGKKELARTREIPATIRGVAPAAKEGEEEIEIKGKKLACRFMEREEGDLVVKTWTCPEVPGGMVKREVRKSGDKSFLRTLELKDWKSAS